MNGQQVELSQAERLALALRAVVLQDREEAATIHRAKAYSSRDSQRFLEASDALDAVRAEATRFFAELEALGVADAILRGLFAHPDGSTLAAWVGISEEGFQRLAAAELAENGLDASDARLLLLTTGRGHRTASPRYT